MSVWWRHKVWLTEGIIKDRMEVIMHCTAYPMSSWWMQNLQYVTNLSDYGIVYCSPSHRNKYLLKTLFSSMQSLRKVTTGLPRQEILGHSPPTSGFVFCAHVKTRAGSNFFLCIFEGDVGVGLSRRITLLRVDKHKELSRSKHDSEIKSNTFNQWAGQNLLLPARFWMNSPCFLWVFDTALHVLKCTLRQILIKFVKCYFQGKSKIYLLMVSGLVCLITQTRTWQ